MQVWTIMQITPGAKYSIAIQDVALSKGVDTYIMKNNLFFD